MTSAELRATARELMELIRQEMANRREHAGTRFMNLKQTAKRARSLFMKAEEIDRRSLNDSNFEQTKIAAA